MPTRLTHESWRASHDGTRYPFEPAATLTNGTQVIPDGVFLDASLHVVGATLPLYLSAVEVTDDQIAVYVGDARNDRLASGRFRLTDLPGELRLVDTSGRDAGLLVSEPERFLWLAALGAGEHVFDTDATAFVATVCHPIADSGVNQLVIQTGDRFRENIWLVGQDGVVLRREDPYAYGLGEQVDHLIRVDVVGDPLYRRKLCDPATDLPPRPVFRRLVVTKGDRTVTATPDSQGDIQIIVHNGEAPDTSLRVYQTDQGLKLEMTGGD